MFPWLSTTTAGRTRRIPILLHKITVKYKIVANRNSLKRLSSEPTYSGRKERVRILNKQPSMSAVDTPASFQYRYSHSSLALTENSVHPKMAFALSSLSGADLALELALFLDKARGGDAVVTKVKSELTAGKLDAALSFILAQSSDLWTSATDKGTIHFRSNTRVCQ